MNCLITGASIGIGHDLAIKFASMNYNLMLTYFSNEGKCLKLKEEIENKYNISCIIKRCDLKNEEDIKKIITIFEKELGNVDILVNNASTSCDNLIEDKNKFEFMEVLETNLVGTFLMSKYALNIMNENGIIINMASTDGIDTVSKYNIDYAASKAGIISLTKSFALSFPNIKTVVIAPNWVDTESTHEMNQEYLKSELKRIGQEKLIKIGTVIDKIVEIIQDKNIVSGSIIRIEGDKNEK